MKVPSNDTTRPARKAGGAPLPALLLPALLAAALLPSCGEQAPAKKAKVILSTFFPMQVMMENLARGAQGVELRLLAPSTTGCLHDYSPGAADMKNIEDADILVGNGAGMEGFLEEVAARKPGMRSIMLAEFAGILLEQRAVNAHAWVSPALYAIQVRALSDFLVGADPDRSAVYAKNAGEYAARIEALGTRMHAALAPYAGTRIVTFHEAFPYFAEEFGFEIVAVVERESGSEPSAADLAAAIEAVREGGARAIFVEPQYPRGPAEAIARETGVPVLEIDPGLGAGGEAGSVADAYIAAMEGNLATLVAALGGARE